MPAGLLMEAGQADLLLISYLGIDRLNRGERVYRLLGCDFTFYDRLPRPGDTLAYDIHVDGHAEHEGIRLFSFHSDAYVGTRRIASWRNAQAGFFTRDELASARGVVWRPDEGRPTPGGRCDPPALKTTRASFDRDAVRAFAEGRPHDCFGPAFARTQTHTRTPRIASDRMLLLDEVTAFDPTGGPWRRGYLRAAAHLDPDRWFFRGHFTNDPCMPGTLMVEMCLQAMAFYLAALGYTAPRDGWLFEPTPDVTSHLMCRSQVVPESKELVCELFVDEVIDGPEPTLYAAVLGTVDGQAAMHSPRMALSLRPGWPIDDDTELLGRLEKHRDPTPVAMVDGFELGYRSLVHGALGKHSDAFGDVYAGHDGPGFLGHLPAPPYHFMSRVVRIDGRPGTGQSGIAAAAEYDVPEASWYFTPEGNFAMPFAALLEVAFQPCGWLAFFAGLPLTRQAALYFRNLDGRGIFHHVVHPGEGPLRTETRLNSVVTVGGPILVNYSVSVRRGPQLVLELDTTFGFFEVDDLKLQPGLPTSDAQVRALSAPSPHRVEIAARRSTPADAAQIGMLDEVTGHWSDGGAAGLGRARARHRVNPAAWFFKAHFVRDPVQPGALGLQAMFELLEHFAVHRDPARMPVRSCFESPALGEPVTWKCRGQVLPENEDVLIEIEITRMTADERGLLLVADGSLWVDGTRIYEATGLSTRMSNR
jgi:3-hydroxymyristoyl/3-hydroxydecanoyl-(acyl carrier protein) dehydratase